MLLNKWSILHCAFEVCCVQCAAGSCMHEVVNAHRVAAIGQWSETKLYHNPRIRIGIRYEGLNPTDSTCSRQIFIPFIPHYALGQFL